MWLMVILLNCCYNTRVVEVTSSQGIIDEVVEMLGDISWR